MQTVTAAPRRARVESIDVLRGVVMIIMTLDHVRDFLGVPANPTDPAVASVPLFFTRWITHICAPVFFLVTGAGAYLSRGRHSTQQLSRFLWTRGLWLIVLELTVLRCFGYQFNVDYRVTMLIILWALGWSMVTLSMLVHLPVPVVTGLGVAVIVLHNLLDPLRPSSFGAFAPVWSVLHSPGVIVETSRHVVFVAYPLIPWIGVTAAGFGLGRVYDWEPARRRSFLLRLGAGLTLAFVALRYANVYGDPAPWSVQSSTVRTVLSFLNTTKYPPSLLFLSMTLGPALLLLWMADRATVRGFRPLRVFGTVPLFYFLLHLPLIHLVAVALCYLRYGDVHWMFESARLDQFPVTFPPGWGYRLPVVYVIWLGIVIALYPLCVWFAGLKRRRTDTWLRYL